MMTSLFFNVPLMQSSNFWLVIFFTISAVLSFGNVQGMKKIQIVFVFFRVFCILCFVFGAIYIIATNGAWPLDFKHSFGKKMNYHFTPFNFAGFNSLCSNVLLTLAVIFLISVKVQCLKSLLIANLFCLLKKH